MNKLIIPILILIIISIAFMPSSSDLVSAINNVRFDVGSCNLIYDSDLTEFAYQRAYEVKASGILSHKDWLKNKPEILDKYYLSELLARSYNHTPAKTNINALLKSWPHKRLLLDPRPRYVGVATISNGDQYILVIILGMPR